MKKKKARSAQPVKGAARPLRSARAGSKAKVVRPKRKTGKRKSATGRRARKATAAAAARRAGAAPKAKRIKAPAVPKGTLEIMPQLALSELPAPPAVAEPELESVAAAQAALQAAKAPGGAELPEKPAPAKPTLSVPPILLEGDEASLPPVRGPGQKYALGPLPPREMFPAEEGELPEAYGTGHLLLTARDPHWVYAHWDLTEQQQRHYDALSARRHLTLRIYVERIEGRPVAEVQVHPESRHWFVHVERAGVRYVVELGYYRADQQWVSIATSASEPTPAETVTEDKSVRWATVTMPAPAPAPQMGATVEERRAPEMPTPREPAMERVPTALPPGVQWAPGPEPVRAEFYGGRLEGEFPAEAPGEGRAVPAMAWTPAQERALAEELGVALGRQTWMGSVEIAELVRRQIEQPGRAAPTGVPVAISSPMGGEEQGISSPFGGEQPQAPGFWFNINAELVIYGATEPDARVVIGARPLKLRPDGTFSCRFSLPDGDYELAVTATSAHEDSRRAELKFSRRTEYRGEVGAHPQDKALKSPAPENVSNNGAR